MLPELEQLVRSPLLVRYRDKITDLLAEEHLKRLQFYETVKEGDKAEFINGEVVVPSPVKDQHSSASERLFTLMRSYAVLHGLGRVGHEKIMISLSRNDYEPDISFWPADVARQFTPKQMRYPAPDFIAEVLSSSTEAVDREIKFTDYAAHGVKEYWLVDPETQVVEQYGLDADGETYRLIAKSGSGQIKSIAVPGFEVPVRAIFDEAENVAALKVIWGQQMQ